MALEWPTVIVLAWAQRAFWEKGQKNIAGRNLGIAQGERGQGEGGSRTCSGGEAHQARAATERRGASGVCSWRWGVAHVTAAHGHCRGGPAEAGPGRPLPGACCLYLVVSVMRCARCIRVAVHAGFRHIRFHARDLPGSVGRAWRSRSGRRAKTSRREKSHAKIPTPEAADPVGDVDTQTDGGKGTGSPCGLCLKTPRDPTWMRSTVRLQVLCSLSS